jgi:uncharacterized protein YggU (UPF0235/DUF167 family)
VLSAVAHAFGVTTRDVALLRGAASRRKLLEVAGGTEQTLEALLHALP